LQSVQDSKSRVQNILLVIHAKERLVLVANVLLGFVYDIHTQDRYIKAYYVVCECGLVNHNVRQRKDGLLVQVNIEDIAKGYHLNQGV
jgi:hypothetical protein